MVMSPPSRDDPLREHYPDALAEREGSEIDWTLLAIEIGRPRRRYERPSSPEGDDGPWLDRLELCQDVARHVRDGGSIDVSRVVLE